MPRIFLIAALSLSILADCSDENCIDKTGTYCDEGVSYWTDSCGEIGEIKEDCACGCRLDHTDCKACECDCEQVSACCDGCLAINEADECDDGDSATAIDMCAAGVCQGFALQRTAPDLPAAPAAPAPVHLESWTCPAGWSAVEHATLTDSAGAPFSWCEPPDIPSVPRLKLGTYVTPLQPGEQDGDRPVCEPEVDGTFPVLGQADCQPLGDACPAGEWPDIPAEVTGARIYVLAGAAGNGTQASPYGVIGDAVAAASAGDVVVIGAGTYREMVAVNKNLTLWGKCVQQTVIDAPGPYVQYSDGAVMVGGQAYVTIRNLRVSGGQNGVRLNSANANVLLEGVWIHEATREGVSQSVYGGTVRLSGVLIDSMQPLSDGTMGWGIGSREDCDVRVESSTIELAREVGLWLAANTVHLQDALVRNSLPMQANGTSGRGLELQIGATLTAQRALFDHNREYGLGLSGNSSADLEDVVVVNTKSDEATGEIGGGIMLYGGSRLTLRRGHISGNRFNGITADGSGTAVTLEDVRIGDTLPEEGSGIFGSGIFLQYGATLVADRLLVEGNRYSGITALAPGTQADLTDLVIQHTEDDFPDHPEHIGDGTGLWVSDGAGVTVAGGLFESNRSAGMIASVAGTTLDLNRVVVRDTRPRAYDSERGFGLEVNDGAEITVVGGLFEGCHSMGALASAENTRLTLTDVTIRDTQSEQRDLTFGIGIRVEDGAHLVVNRGLLERNRQNGILAEDPATVADLTDITVLDTMLDESQGFIGTGLEGTFGARVSVTRGLFQGNHYTGILSGSTGTVFQLQDVTVRDTLSRRNVNQLWPEAGLLVAEGASVVLSRGLFEGNRTSGIIVAGAGTVADLNAVTVRDTLSQEGLGLRGLGVWASLGAQVTCTDGLFERNREVGVFAHGPGTRLEFERVAVTDTLAQEAGRLYGRGLNVQQGATARMAYSVIDGNQNAGVFVYGDNSAVELEEVLVSNTRSRELDLMTGRGLSVQAGGQAVVRASVFYQNRDVSVSAYGQGAELTLERVMIKDSLQRECALVDPPTCAGQGAGTGLGSYAAASVFIDAVNVANSAQAGVQLAVQGTLTGSNLILRDNPIGVNVQDVPGDYDFFEAVTDLLMENNGINFDSTALSVPDPMDTLDIE